MNIEYQELRQEDLTKDILSNFNRYQEVKRCWRKENNQWVLKDICFIEDWNKSKRERVVGELVETINNKGSVFGAFVNKQMIAFASLENERFGPSKEYIELKFLHVSFEFRGLGIGKKLFLLITKKANQKAAKKLYISAHSSEESQKFYKKIGCLAALYINKEIYENEPFDCQLEYVIK